MADIRTQVFDLGFAVGKIEEAGDGGPMLTIMSPAVDTQAASSVVISDWENLSALAIILLEFTAGWRDAQEPGRDEIEDFGTGDESFGPAD